jgi:integrating conjugative element protein (TIGR03752 family)
MLKNISPTMKVFGGLIVGVLVIMVIAISVSGNQTPKQPAAHYVNDNASADNKVEALKTMTADLLSVENKNKTLQQNVANMQAQNKASIGQLKQSVVSQVQTALQKIQTQNEQKQTAFESSLKQKEKAQAQDYPVNGGSGNGAFIWVSNLSKLNVVQKTSSTSHQVKGFFSADGHSGKKGSLLHTGDNQQSSASKIKKTIKPVYTMPVNATLTGATLMTPLVGRVPIDGKLPSPYHFKLVLSGSNLTANGYPMPGVKGAVMSGIASGDMLGSCARGDIHSITFIFNDGTISTTQAQGDSASLGYISGQTGNPCISGTFHSNAAVFLGSQMTLAGAEGYASTISSSQYMNGMTPDGGSIHALIGSANKAAVGQGGTAAAQAAQTWWNQRVRDSFDYVYVPNVNPKTRRPTKVVVNITKQIPIDYNPNARKVNYDNSLQTLDRQLD